MDISDIINNINNCNNVIDYIKTNKINNIINILALSKIDNFTDILDKCFIYNDFIDSKVVNYFKIISNESFNKLYILLSYLKNKYNNIFIDIIKLYSDGIWFLDALFSNVDLNYIYKFWQLYNDINLTLKDNKNKTLFIILILRYNIEYSDIIYKILDEYLIIYPKILLFSNKLLPLLEVIYFESKNIDNFNTKLIELFLKYNKDIINQFEDIRTILFYPIRQKNYKLFDYLIEKNADLNIRSMVDIALLSESKDIHNILLKHIEKVNFNYYNPDIETYPYIIFKNPELYDIKLKKEVLLRCDILYKSNFQKNNLLHLLFNKNFNDNLNQYIPILIKKQLDWTTQNIYKISPLQLLENKFNDILNNLLLPNYIYFLNYRINLKKINLLDKFILQELKKDDNITINNINKNNADIIIKEYINDIFSINKKIILLDFNHVNYSMFSCYYIDINCYFYYLCSTYDNISLSYAFKVSHKNNCSFNCDFKQNKICYDEFAIKACEYIQNSHKYIESYKMLYNNNMLIWFDEINYNIPENLFEDINKLYNYNKYRYIYIIEIDIRYKNVDYGHANILIINFKHNIAFRFDPTGYILNSNIHYLDNIIQDKINKVFKNINYYTPNNYMKNLFFQGISSEDYYKRIGDPGGFCVAWCIWFIESYINNEDTIINIEDLKEYVINISNKIISKYDSYVEYIRNYANYLKNKQIKFYKLIGMPDNLLYLAHYTDNDNKYILNEINTRLEKVLNISLIK